MKNIDDRVLERGLNNQVSDKLMQNRNFSIGTIF
jgi:hypothetical protein